MSKHINQTYGRLTVLSIKRIKNKQHAVCACSCGAKKRFRLNHVTSGRTTSCGCYKRESAALRNSTHNMSKSKEYLAWRNLRSRCSNPKDKSFCDYGGRGISVCEEWDRDFQAFYNDMGPAPSCNHSIERVDVNGPYSKDNCVWATAIDQARNKRNSRAIHAFGETRHINEWAELFGIPVDRIRARIDKLGWGAEKALKLEKYESWGL